MANLDSNQIKLVYNAFKPYLNEQGHFKQITKDTRSLVSNTMQQLGINIQNEPLNPNFVAIVDYIRSVYQNNKPEDIDGIIANLQ